MHTDPLAEISEDPLARIGLIMLAAIALMALFAPLLSNYSPHDYTGKIFSPPDLDHPLGTDCVGQDIWVRLLYGARTSLIVAGAVAILSSSLSVLIGATAALAGGYYDRFCMRLVDAITSLPTIVVMILVAAYLRPSLALLIILISVFSWPAGARIVRSQVLSLRERVHINASRTFGASKRHIIFTHIVPELSPIISSLMMQDARRAVFMEAGLAFLGVSDPMVISWGKMMHQALAFTYLDVWQWWLVPTGLALSATLIAISFLSISLESAMDPRLAKGNARLR
jgi:peptide/nickel transport system permease protein